MTRGLSARTRLLAALSICAAICALTIVGVRAPSAGAHPLGNFTINHFTRVQVGADGIDVMRVLDMAEFPTVQERQLIDTDGDDQIGADEGEAYASAKVVELADNLIIELDGRRIELTAMAHELSFLPGEGGLETLRLVGRYEAPLPEGWSGDDGNVTIEDRNYSGRLGWREIVVRGVDGVDAVNTDAPAESISQELLVFPEDIEPLDMRRASFRIEPGAGLAPAVDSDVERAVRGNPDEPLAKFAELITEDDGNIGVVLLALLFATGFGAIHALSPGHGKTIVAAYLVGSRGTAWHAVLLALTVTLTHTSSVYLLGFVTLYFSEYIVPERMYPYMGIASGLIIIGMGLALLISRLRVSNVHAQMLSLLPWIARNRALQSEAGALTLSQGPHDDGHGHHDGDGGHTHDNEHGHEHGTARDHHEAAGKHSHGFGPAHSHAIPGQDGEPVTVRRLIGLGIFGGMLPCPSAIVVMLSAISLHKVGFGLLLIVFFSLGLGGVLTAIGFAMVYGRAIAERVPAARAAGDRFTSTGAGAFAVRVFPAASAFIVVCAGVLVTLNAASGL